VIRSQTDILRSPSIPFVAPFGVLLALLAARAFLPIPDLAGQVVQTAGTAAVLLCCSRSVVDFRVRSLLASVCVGILVFVVWIAPDLLFPGYRSLWLFQNPVTGTARSTLSALGQADPLVLVLRTFRAVVLVPIVEELFWRAWLMRWLIRRDFLRAPLGAYTHESFWLVAVLFASEHGAYWDVGLAAGIAYNWWMIRTKSLGDLMLAHAVTNACLSAYVIAAGKWEYWL
jgi:hypothetical protein